MFNLFRENKQQIHIIFEFLALLIVIPFMIYLLYSKDYCLETIDKVIIISIIISTLIVDGGLLYLNVFENNINRAE